MDSFENNAGEKSTSNQLYLKSTLLKSERSWTEVAIACSERSETVHVVGQYGREKLFYPFFYEILTVSSPVQVRMNSETISDFVIL